MSASVLALDGVAAVAGVPLERVVIAAHQGEVVAVVAEDEVVAGAAEERIVALRPEQFVRACAPVDRQLDDGDWQRRRRDDIVFTEGVDDQAVIGRLRVGDVDPRRQADHRRRGAGTGNVDVIDAVRAVDDDRVRLGIAGGAPEDAREVAGELDDIGARQIADGDRVGSADGVEVDGLDVVEIHHDVAEVAREQHALTVGRRLEDLVAVAAVEQHRVGVRLALDDIAAVARIPLERVVPAAEEGDVVALLTVDDIVVATAEEHVLAIAAEDRVAARTAVHGDLDQGGQVPGGGEAVFAAIGIEHEILGRADVDGERCRIDPVEPHACPVGRGGEDLGPAAAVDLHGVGATAALVEVGVVARVPDHRVVAAPAEDLIVGVASGERVLARSAEQRVKATAAVDGVVASLAEEQVATRAAAERVPAGAAEEVGAGQCAVRLVEGDHVAAALAEHLNECGVGDGRRAAADRDRAVVHEQVAGGVAAHGERVGAAVAEDGEHTAE